MYMQYKSAIHLTNTAHKFCKQKFLNRIIFIVVMAVAALMYTSISQAQTVPFCTPNFPLCLTTPQQAAINTLNNLPSRISTNRFVQGGTIPGLRSQISPILDARFPLFPFQNFNSSFVVGNSFNPNLQGGGSIGSPFAPINFQAIDQKYGDLFNLGFLLRGF